MDNPIHLEQITNLIFYSKLKKGEKIYFYTGGKDVYTKDGYISRLWKIFRADIGTIEYGIKKITEEMNEVLKSFDEYYDKPYYKHFNDCYKGAIAGLKILYETYKDEERDIAQILIITSYLEEKLSLHEKEILEE
jgi:hypothetical protein